MEVALGLAAVGVTMVGGAELLCSLTKDGQEGAQGGLRTLYDLVISQRDDDELVTIVLVHIDRAALADDLAGRNVSVGVEHGRDATGTKAHRACRSHGESLRFVQRVDRPREVAADFEQACCCLMAGDKRSPVIRVKLREHLGAGVRRVLGHADVPLPADSAGVERSQVELEPRGLRRKLVGQLTLGVALRAVRLGDIRETHVSGICKFKRFGFWATKHRLHVGEVRDGDGAAEPSSEASEPEAEGALVEGEVMRGDPVRRVDYRETHRAPTPALPPRADGGLHPAHRMRHVRGF